MAVCPLCQNNQSKLFYEEKKRVFFLCPNCFLVFIPGNLHLAQDQEKERYDFHQNDPLSENYQAYKSWMKDFYSWIGKENFKGQGCDYGAGPHPIFEEILREEGKSLSSFFSYDIYYAPNTKPQNGSLDFIILSEVVEHFRNPQSEWKKIKECLKNEARLFVRTSLWSEKTNWNSWAYARDHTHVAFYHLKTFAVIAQMLEAKVFRLEGDKIEMRRETL